MAFIKEAVKLGLASLAAKADKDPTDEVSNVAKLEQLGVDLLAVAAAQTKTKLDDAAVAGLQKVFSSPDTAPPSGNLVEDEQEDPDPSEPKNVEVVGIKKETVNER